MPPSRHFVLAALLVTVAVLTGVLLLDVLATVFFAITVAYVLVPLYQWFRRRGLSGWWSSAASTTAAFLSIVLLFIPIGIILYIRRGSLVALFDALPERATVEFFGFAYAVNAGDVTDLAIRHLTRLALGVARATPVIAAKAVVFGFLVFALLLRRHQVRRALLGPVPDGHHDIPIAIHERLRQTLFALYVIQAATAFGTFLIALPLFWLLGYTFPVALAVVAGVLQFLPVVGPSLVVVALAAYEVSVGAYGKAILVLVLGLVLVGVLPDAVLRPRLARQTARLPASLYFVGFTGGILSLGPVGIIAGPLAIALLVEALSLLIAEVNRERMPASGGG